MANTPADRAEARIRGLKDWAEDRRAKREVEGTPAPSPKASHQPTAAESRAVRRLIEEHSHEVANLSRPKFRALVPLLEQAKHEVARDLAAWLRKHPDGQERYTAQKLSGMLVSLRGSLGTVRQLGPRLDGVLGDIRHDTAQLSTGHLIHEVARMSSMFEGIDYKPKVDLAAIIAVGDKFFIQEHRTSAARYAGSVATDIQGELAKGMLLNETIGDMTDRLVKIGGPRGMVATRGIHGEPGAKSEHIAEGLFKRYRWWAERIVRDQISATYTFQALAGYFEARQQIPDLEKRWDASIDRRTCGECAELDGAVVPLEALFPGGVDGAPLHSCCRCRTGAWRAHWGQYMQWADELVAEEAA